MSFTEFVYSSFASTQPNDGKTGGLNVIISVMKNVHSTKFGDYEVTNLDETTYQNYREFVNIRLQHD